MNPVGEQPHPAFVRRAHFHNITVVIAAVLSAAAAAVVWFFLYFGGQWAILSFRTSVEGETARLPEDYDLWFGFLLSVSLLTVLVWRWTHPPRPPQDRPILGWHLVGEFLLLPGWLILACSDQCAAWQSLSRGRLLTAWQLLQAFARQPKWPEPHLPQLGLDAGELPQALRLLQYLGLIDLHRGRPYWFYRLRSSEEATVRRWMETAGALT